MRRILVSLSAITLLAAPITAQETPGEVARMAQIASAQADSGEFMGSVLVARDGKIVFDKGYGSANLEWGIPNDGDTKFRLGSITKQFTAVAILQLMERGKLDLQAPIKTYLPDAPAAWDKVTVFNLLTHTSGIPNFTGFDEYDKTKTLPATLDSLIARFKDKPLEFAPGEGWNYSNSGYILLTAIVEKASGQDYGAFVEANLFKPLGMADTGIDTRKAILPHRAEGYVRGPTTPLHADYVDMSIPRGAGALYSTTHDLLKWETGLFGGKLLKPASMTLLTTPFKNAYALGLSVAEKDEGTTIAHGGGIEGFNTWMGYDPARKLTVIVLGNLNGPAPDRLGKSLMTVARGGTVTLTAERVAIPVPADQLREYEGKYALSPDFIITVTLEGDHLMAQATNQPAFQIYPEAKDKFFLKVVDAQLSFTRDATGKITGAVLHQGGRDAPAAKQ